ncbi:MAG TPA: hypothetical protein VLL74_05145 [Methanoregula sp.]|nr:hypothetical protein [Methanoregula sp.]
MKGGGGWGYLPPLIPYICLHLLHHFTDEDKKAELLTNRSGHHTRARIPLPPNYF